MNTYLDYKKYLFYRLPSTIYTFLELDPEIIITSSNAYVVSIETTALNLGDNLITTSSDFSTSLLNVIDLTFSSVDYIDTDGEAILDTLTTDELLSVDNLIQTGNKIRVVRVDISELSSADSDIITSSVFDMNAYEILEIISKSNIITASRADINAAELVDVDVSYGTIITDELLSINMVNAVDIDGFNETITTDSNVNADRLVANQMPVLNGYGLINITAPNITITVLTVRDRYSNTDEFLGLDTTDFLNLTTDEFFEVEY